MTDWNYAQAGSVGGPAPTVVDSNGAAVAVDAGDTGGLGVFDIGVGQVAQIAPPVGKPRTLVITNDGPVPVYLQVGDSLDDDPTFRVGFVLNGKVPRGATHLGPTEVRTLHTSSVVYAAVRNAGTVGGYVTVWS